MRNLKTKVWNIFFLSILLMVTPPAVAQEDLAKQTQNPLGTIISLPFENTFLFGIGPSDSTACVLNWKPVYPVDLGDWNLQFTIKFLLPK